MCSHKDMQKFWYKLILNIYLGPDNVLYVYEKRSHVMGTAQNSLDLNVVLKLFLIIPEIFGYIEVPIILFAPMKWRE